MTEKIRLAFSPDPDDAFAYHALVHGLVPTHGWMLDSVETAPIEELNVRARRGTADLVAISSVYYPWIARSYQILRAGASVGRGYGPLLASRPGATIASIGAGPVAVPGWTTTGCALLRLFFPGMEIVERPFDTIRDEIARGDVAAGVLIHEELLNYGDRSLAPLLCLGAEWTRRTRLPLPVGLNVLSRRLSADIAADVARAVRESMLHALAHREEAESWARRFGRGPGSRVASRFIEMFANADTVAMPPDVEAGLRTLLRDLAVRDLVPWVPDLDLLESAPRVDPAGPPPLLHSSPR